jgi:hypothetical protein
MALTRAAMSAEIARLQAENIRLRELVDDKYPPWDTLVWLGRRYLAEFYPPDIFDGSSGDPGPAYVVALREALARLDR